MTDDTVDGLATDSRTRVTVTGKLMRNPLLWAAGLLAASILCGLAGDALGFVPFLLALVGGLCVGFALVNLTLGMGSPRNGAILHVAIAVVLGALLAVMVEYGPVLLAPLPEGIGTVVFLLQMAAIPAAGWIWLGLISRVTACFSQRDARRRPAPVPPEWQRDASGDGTVIEFSGIPMRMRELTRDIVAIVVAGGLVAVTLLILFDDVVMRIGARIAILVFGVAIALPLYLLLLAQLRRRTMECAVAFGNDEVRVRIGSSHHTVLFSDLDLLRWRARSDYARLEVRGSETDLSVIAGIARPPAGRSAELPVLPRRVFRRLELAGLRVERDRRGDVITFRRPPG